MSAPLPVEITGSTAAAEAFRWPAPPYFEFVREQDRYDWADCLLILRDGTEASGRIHSFVPEETLLTFRADGTGETVSVAFSVLLGLQLRRPVELKRSRARVAEVKSTAIAAGMRSLRQDGIAKVVQGVTDIQQVSAVCN